MLYEKTGHEFPIGALASVPPRQRLHLILLGVNDIGHSQAFYEALGWKKSPSGHDEFVKFDLGGYALCLLSRAALAEDARARNEKSTEFNGVCFVHLVKTPEDVPAVLAKAVEAGGTLVKPATRTPWGIAGYFKDPDGYLFEVDYEEVFIFDEENCLIVDQLNQRTV